MIINRKAIKFFIVVPTTEPQNVKKYATYYLQNQWLPLRTAYGFPALLHDTLATMHQSTLKQNNDNELRNCVSVILMFSYQVFSGIRHKNSK